MFLRPRISQREAKFVLDCLKRDRERIEEKLNRLKVLEAETDRIRREFRFNAYAAIRDNLGDKKAELEQLKAETKNIHEYLSVYASLIAKYDALASGKKQRGRYTVKADSVEVWLSILGY
jgi:DNA repair exonuclease SbcCD ATPase subunit